MPTRDFLLEEMVENCKKGAWQQVAHQIAGDRYSAGSTAVALALELFREYKPETEMVERLLKEIEYAEECT